MKNYSQTVLSFALGALILTTALSFLTLTSAHAAGKPLAVDVMWKCDSDSDPDTVSVDIHKVGNKLVAYIDNLTGDGDDFGMDFIELKQVRPGTFTQIAGAHPTRLAGYEGKATHKTEGTQIEIDLSKAEKGIYSATVSAKVGPADVEIDAEGFPLDCEAGPALEK